MEMEVETSLVGDGSCSKEVFKGGYIKGKGKKRYKEPMLSLVGVKKEYGKEGRGV